MAGRQISVESQRYSFTGLEGGRNMPCPTCTYTFLIQSLHDTTPLLCTLHQPNSTPLHIPKPYRIALLAHPYAPIGGNSRDPVLALITSTLLEKGYIVVLFDFRGAGGSGGSTSWSGVGEREDFVSVLGFCLVYLSTVCLLLGRGDGAGKGDGDGDGKEQEERGVSDVLLAGYSYGSLIVQSLAPFERILERFYTAEEGSGEGRIMTLARGLAAEHTHTSPRQSPSTYTDINIPAFRPSYLLISPLLPPISTLLMLQLSRTFGSNNESALRLNRSLAVFGGRDTFTSSARLVEWATRLKRAEGSQFSFAEIGDAGHFWREDGVGKELKSVVASWVDSPYR